MFKKPMLGIRLGTSVELIIDLLIFMSIIGFKAMHRIL
jgi:hypothetical protein